MNLPENIKPNRTQAIGLFFMVISLFSYLGGFVWFSAYWDTEYIETYRDFEIYYFPNINVYGIKTTGDPMDWPHTSALSACRNKIDSWLDEPTLMETVRDWEIYKINSYGLYYGANGDLETGWYDSVNSTRLFIEAEYYPTLVYELHLDGDTWEIYRQGAIDVRYWVEYEGTALEYFTTLEDAKEYARDRVEIAKEEQPAEHEPEETEEQINTGIPILDEILNPDPENTQTLGQLLNTQKLMISAVTATMGLGFIVLGSVKREED